MSWRSLYLLDIAAMLGFLFSYYRNCYRRGYRIDFWHEQLFLFCILPNFIMLPIARNELNVLVVGRDFDAVVSVLPMIFLVTVVGYASILLGGFLWRLEVGIGLRRATTSVLDFGPRCSMMLMSSRGLLLIHTLMCLALQAMILLVYFSNNGFGLDLRGYTFAHPEMRPIALAISGYSVTIASHCLARYIDTHEKPLLACTLLLTSGLVFFGARSNLLNIYLNILICYLISLRTRVSLVRIVGVSAVICVAGIYLGSARGGEYSLADFFKVLGVLLLFGDNFSDLRDFAWVYALWNHTPWAGKTYLAAFMAFIPRFVSEFRDTWGLGVATATTLGLDPHVHPGVRPGIFGEGFFNFGLLGVIAVGLILGVVLRRVDSTVKSASSSDPARMRKAFASTMLLGVASAVAVSSSWSGVYAEGAIYLFAWILLSLRQTVWTQHSPASMSKQT